MQKDITTSITIFALVVGCAKCDLDQPHIHVENKPYEQSVSTLSYTTTTNIASPVFGFDQDNYLVAGFDKGHFI